MTMLRRLRWLTAVALLGAMLIPQIGSAQQSNLPPELAAVVASGVTVDLLSGSSVSPSVDAPALVLRRLVPEPGGDQIVYVAGPELWYVESGSLKLGKEGANGETYQAGETAVLDGGGSYTFHVDGETCPSALRLEITTVFAMEVSSDVPGPKLSSESSPCPLSGILARSTGPLTIPEEPAFAFIARMTWPAEMVPAESKFSGPVGYAPESGALKIDLLPGGTLLLSPTSWIVIDGQQGHSVTGADNKTATALVAGLISSGESAPPTPTVVSGVRGTTYTSPTYGYRVNWDSSWAVRNETTGNGEDLLQLNNGVSDVYLHSFGNYGEKAPACVKSIASQLPTNAGFSNVEPLTTAGGDPIEGGDDARYYAVFEFDYSANGSSTTRYAEYIECRPIVPGQSVLVITQIVTQDAYSSQVEAFRTLDDAIVIPKT